MNNNEFDKKITDIVGAEDIPFNEDNWAGMQQMLDKKEDRRLLLPLLFNPYSAAAAVLLILVTSVYFLVQQPRGTFNNVATTHQPPVQHIPLSLTGDTSGYNTIPVVQTIPVIAKQKQSNAEVQDKQPAIVHTTMEDSGMTIKKASVAVKEPETYKSDKWHNDYFPVGDDEDAQRNRLIFGINSGIALYESDNSFTAGLIVKNNITSRISVQAGLAFMQSRQDISVKHIDVINTPVIMGTDTGLVPGIQTTITERYEQYSRNLPYIQFNPSLSVKIFRKFYGSVGGDVQRLIISQSALDTMNKHLGEVGKKVARTDVGVTLSMNYRITKHIGFGVSYRNSLTGMSTDKVQYIKRNYCLLQLQYIFNAE